MKKARVISKYPNRRLYDTAESRYITLSDIQQLVIKNEQFQVIDKKSGENITRSILLHVIAEKEEGSASVMSENFLTRVIRSYDSDTPEIVRSHLERNLSRFLDQQQAGSSPSPLTGQDGPEIEAFGSEKSAI
jgi:polyhydroxyalkanoate synthesis repressor PhaR